MIAQTQCRDNTVSVHLENALEIAGLLAQPKQRHSALCSLYYCRFPSTFQLLRSCPYREKVPCDTATGLLAFFYRRPLTRHDQGPLDHASWPPCEGEVRLLCRCPLH